MSDARPRIAFRRIVPAVLLAVLMASVCAGLGWWQWTRANQQAVPVQPGPPVPLAEVLAPSSPAVDAVGRRVEVVGSWEGADAALVTGREVDGVAAVLLVRPLLVDDPTTGQTATLPVVVGWRPAGDPTPSVQDLAPGDVDIVGWLRPSEGANVEAELPSEEIPGTFWTAAMSAAEFAQLWSQPLYSAVLVSEDASSTFEPLPPPPPETSLDVRSLAYAAEWWIFGLFVLVITGRWIRDNRYQTMLDE